MERFLFSELYVSKHNPVMTLSIFSIIRICNWSSTVT